MFVLACAEHFQWTINVFADGVYKALDFDEFNFDAIA